MIKINVDSSIKEFDNSVNGFQVLKALGEDAPKGSVAMKIDGKAVDLSKEINKDCNIEFIDKFSPEGLEIIRYFNLFNIQISLFCTNTSNQLLAKS